MDLQLRGKVAWVTGAAYGVGRSVALALAAEGASVAVHYRSSKESAQKTCESIKGLGVKAVLVQCDISKPTEVESAHSAITEALGPVEILINNAAFVMPKRFVESQLLDWLPQFEVTVFGTMQCTRSVLPSMIEARSGRIITITGDAGKIGESRLAAASAARAAAIGLTRALAKEVGRFGITVNGVSLGLTRTEGMEKHTDPAWLEQNLQRILSFYPLGRLGTPQDVAPIVTMLASPLAGFITGQVLSVSGGYTTV